MNQTTKKQVTLRFGEDISTPLNLFIEKEKVESESAAILMILRRFLGANHGVSLGESASDRGKAESGPASKRVSAESLPGKLLGPEWEPVAGTKVVPKWYDGPEAMELLHYHLEEWVTKELELDGKFPGVAEKLAGLVGPHLIEDIREICRREVKAILDERGYE